MNLYDKNDVLKATLSQKTVNKILNNSHNSGTVGKWIKHPKKFCAMCFLITNVGVEIENVALGKIYINKGDYLENIE